MAQVPEPRIARSFTLHYRGDWGQANLHRICGWLAQEVVARSGPGSGAAIWTGRGGTDTALAVAGGKVDLGLVVPDLFAPWALEGIGPFQGKTYPNLRALGNMPQLDRMVFAIRADLGIRTFAELRAKKPALRIAAAPDDGVNMTGYTAHRLMEACGLPRATIESWGGTYLDGERPRHCTKLVQEGKADAIVQEAIMTDYWQELANKVDLAFLDVEPDALATMERKYRWQSATLPKGYMRGMDKELVTIDFSNFLMIARDDMPDDVAYLLAWCMCETKSVIEAAYKHIPPIRSPVTYPLEPKKIARTTIALHPGAERYYRESGAL